MTAAGRSPTGPSTLAYTSELGAVFRTPCGDASLYTKCPVPFFVAEGRVTRALGAGTPAWVPVVVDVEPGEGWLVMEDLGNRALGDEPPSEWAGGLAVLGQLQRAWIGRSEELVAAGAQRRPLRDVPQALPTLLEVGGLGERLDPSLRAAWPAARDRLLEACRELEDLGLPETVMHGDFHPWNVAIAPDGLRIFDWSDTAIGAPFLDLAIYLGRAPRAARSAILEPYLRGWSDVAPRAALERAAALAMPLGALYQVLTYQALAPALAGRGPSEFTGADASWLRNALAGLDQGLDARFSFGSEGSPD
jgi:hypothetical protein